MVTGEDRLEIIELIGRFSHAFDGGDVEAFARVFSENGIFNERIGGKDFVRGRGQSELREYVQKEMAERGVNQPRHHVRNTVFFQVADNRVVTRTYMLATNVAGEGRLAAVTATGIYEDEIVRTPEGWRILKRNALYD